MGLLRRRDRQFSAKNRPDILKITHSFNMSEMRGQDAIELSEIMLSGLITCEESEGFSCESLELSTLQLNSMASCSWMVASSPFVPLIIWKRVEY